jgi:signal peptidase
MVPTIPVGALVVATRVPASELAKGDVIVFERPDRPGTMVVHRIFAVEDTPSGRAFLTKGDANSSPDGWRVPATGSGWRSVMAIPRAGFAVGWLHTALSRRGWLGAVAIAAAVYALMTIWKTDNT